MISKEKFVKIINRLKETNEMQDKINDLYRNTEDARMSDFNNVSHVGVYFEDIVVDLLQDIFQDRENSWLCYWLYDLWYGTEYTEGCVKEDGESIDISTPEKLYDFLIQEMKGE